MDLLIIQALARAVYSRGELILLDDVLSGLDSKTENAVFHSLLGRDGLLRRAGMTILLASSDGKSSRPVVNLELADTFFLLR